jgi:hypothetical protein
MPETQKYANHITIWHVTRMVKDLPLVSERRLFSLLRTHLGASEVRL